MAATRVVVDIPGESPYDVRIGEGVLEELGAKLVPVLAAQPPSRILVISDSNVAPLYLDTCKQGLAALECPISDITIPAGEEAKCLDVIGEVWSAIAALGLGRDGVVVALGGGVVGDLAGFAGSTFMRGLRVVQVPTTLLSMVDSSVGGKTGINLDAGKNLVGTFMQPSYVCASTDVLATLDQREWACGCAEIAKAAVIDSDAFFFWLMENASLLADREADVVREAIARSVVFKADVVAQDKTESCGVRECLNYGHTLGHAIETLAGYGTFSHGAAVAEGMRFAARLGQTLVGTPLELVEAQDSLLDQLGLGVLDWQAPAQQILDAMKHDKKSRQGAVRFVLPVDVGDWQLTAVDDEVILEHLRLYFGE